jgi:hypothetical protein
METPGQISVEINNNGHNTPLSSSARPKHWVARHAPNAAHLPSKNASSRGRSADEQGGAIESPRLVVCATWGELSPKSTEKLKQHIFALKGLRAKELRVFLTADQPLKLLNMRLRSRSKFRPCITDAGICNRSLSPANIARIQHRKIGIVTYTTLLRVARTIADLAGAETTGHVHVAEALSYRRQAPRA